MLDRGSQIQVEAWQREVVQPCKSVVDSCTQSHPSVKQSHGESHRGLVKLWQSEEQSSLVLRLHPHEILGTRDRERDKDRDRDKNGDRSEAEGTGTNKWEQIQGCGWRQAHGQKDKDRNSNRDRGTRDWYRETWTEGKKQGQSLFLFPCPYPSDLIHSSDVITWLQILHLQRQQEGVFASSS